jgi:hypothetical protein
MFAYTIDIQDRIDIVNTSRAEPRPPGGDGLIADGPVDVVDTIVALVERFAPDVVVAGPAFGAGRYGLACARVCAAVTRHLGVPALAAMAPDNAAVEPHRREVLIVPTAATAIGMKDALAAMARLATRLGRGEALGPAAVEGYLPRGRRMNARARLRPASARSSSCSRASTAGRSRQRWSFRTTSESRRRLPSPISPPCGWPS